MSVADAPLVPLDDRLSTLTEMIFAEIGAPLDLATDEGARAKAVSRIEQLLCGFIAHEMHEALTAEDDDCSVDIIFGRKEAEFAFEELTMDLPLTKRA